MQKRYDMFLERRKAVEQQMENLSKMLAILNHKCLYYETALQTGSEKNICRRIRCQYADAIFSCRKMVKEAEDQRQTSSHLTFVHAADFPAYICLNKQEVRQETGSRGYIKTQTLL